MEIKYIPPHELKDWWGFAKEGVEAILSKSPEPYIQEEIFAQLWAQKSMLWVFMDENVPQGFTVLTPEQDNLFVWAIWGKTPQSFEVVSECFEMIKGIAKQGNAKTITFGSHRIGWDKVARKLGFTPRLWELKIEE
jgi:hypothetical protein